MDRDTATDADAARVADTHKVTDEHADIDASTNVDLNTEFLSGGQTDTGNKDSETDEATVGAIPCHHRLGLKQELSSKCQRFCFLFAHRRSAVSVAFASGYKVEKFFHSRSAVRFAYGCPAVRLLVAKGVWNVSSRWRQFCLFLQPRSTCCHVLLHSAPNCDLSLEDKAPSL